MTKELTIEKKNVKDVQKTLEEEILQRVTAENKLQSLKENFKFKEEVKLTHIFSMTFFCIKIFYRFINNNLMIQELVAVLKLLLKLMDV